MYKVRIEARADILGNVMERFTVRVDAVNRLDAMRKAVVKAHDARCQSYGIPVHFVAKDAKIAH